MSSRESLAGRGGFALPVAVLALVVVGVLVTGGFYMARQESRVGVASENASMAFYIAEQGMNDVMAGWSAARYSQIPAWQADTVTGSIPQGAYTVAVHRLSDFLYFLESEGTVTRGGRLAGATRRLGQLARIRTAWVEPQGALTTQGHVSVRGTATVNGFDQNPNGWDDLCADVEPENAPGVVYNEGGSATTQGSGTIQGSPATVQNNDIDNDTFLDYGDLTWEDLIEYASVRIPGSTSTMSSIAPSVTQEGACDVASISNWGEPYTSQTVVTPSVTAIEACQGHFPVIHHPGPSLRLQGSGRGQGILLVGTVTRDANGNITSMAGDLDLRGDFTFNGIIIVLGQFQTQAGHSPRITGGVLAGNATIELDGGCVGVGCYEIITGSSLVQYSSCAIRQAILNNSDLAMARPLIQRGWVDLSNIGSQ